MFISPITIGSPSIHKPPEPEKGPANDEGENAESEKPEMAANDADDANKAPDYDELNAQAAERIIKAGANMRGSLLNVRA